MRARSDDERAFACPQTCPELDNSESSSEHRAPLSRAESASGAREATHFKSGKPAQPTGWKVRFLRRSANSRLHPVLDVRDAGRFDGADLLELDLGCAEVVEQPSA